MFLVLGVYFHLAGFDMAVTGTVIGEDAGMAQEINVPLRNQIVLIE